MGGGYLRAFLTFAALAGSACPQVINSVKGVAERPFQSAAHARVFVFVRTDCPISNRYAPELQRIATEFKGRGMDFWLVYSDASETPANIERQISDYKLPGEALLDPQQKLARRAEAAISPQAAVFDHEGRLTYSGRIDDRFVDFGKSRPEAATHDLEAAISATLDGKAVAHPRTKAIGCYLADVQ
jgi:AhpC/TSA family